jgi:flavorubredoxin
MTEFLDSKYVCVGSPTLNSQMLAPVSAFLTYMKGLSPKNDNRIGFAFGSYGWAPLGPANVQKELEGAGFQMPEKPFAVNWIPGDSDIEEVRAKAAALIAAGKDE